MGSVNKNPVVTFGMVSILLGATLGSISCAFGDNNMVSALKTVLDESNNLAKSHIEKVQTMGLAITANANSSYTEGLTEYNAAVMSLNVGDLDNAKIHAFKAMNLFKATTELLIQEENSNQTGNDASQAALIAENIANSASYADELRSLAERNNMTVSFTDYDNTMNASKTLLVSGDLVGANQQLTVANGLLENINAQLQAEANSKNSERAKEFVNGTIIALDKMITNAKEIGLSQSIVDELQNAVYGLQNASSLDQIINESDQSSQLENAIKLYNDGLLQNFDKAVVTIQNDINIQQSNAEKLGIHLQQVDDVNALLVDIKQKIASGQTANAAQELDQVNSLIADMNNITSNAENQNMLSLIMNNINQLQVQANSLNTTATQRNTTDARGEINTSFALISEAKILATQGNLSDAANMLIDVQTHLNKATNLVQLGTAKQLEGVVGTLYTDASNQNNTAAIAIIQNATVTINQAKDLSANGNYDLAQQKLSAAGSMLESASTLISEVDQIMTQISDLSNKTGTLASLAQNQNNTQAISEIDQAISLINHAITIAPQGEITQAQSDLEQAKNYLNNVTNILNGGGK